MSFISFVDMNKFVHSRLLRSFGLVLKRHRSSFKAAPKKKVEKEKSTVSELKPWPSYIQDRLTLWDKLKAEYDAKVASKTPENITVTLPDGKAIPAESWRTTPYDIAMGISKGLAENAVISKVDGVLWDLDRPLESSCKLQLLKFDDEEAQQVFWHSTAHVLGEAMERVYGGCLCYGPPIENGYYYDMFLPDKQVSNLDFPVIEGLMKTIAKEKQPFERLEMTKEQLLEMFKYNEFKVRILNEKVTTPTTTVYRCGPLIDLCRGPHVRNTGKIKSLKVTKNSATYWEGKADAESLQRVYGISFPDPKQMKEWEKIQEEAAKRDHRKLGREQELFFFHELSPGSCFFQPKGAHIYNSLVEFIREEYRKRGFQEVVSPNIYNSKLWKTSGHWAHYAENMFSFEVEKEQYALKPMNCPGHCLIFDHRPRSWKELPWRVADFGVLHRNEFSGALTGLTRVRRFQQDDAHIFCMPDQIKSEISACLDFMKHALSESLNEFGEPWKENPGDGAFYGPKIDITIMDALRRPHQCATIQLDFQLPVRFDLSYIGVDGEKKKPVMIHRAILGSVERMIAVLTESYAGKWPFWISPRQAMVIPVAGPFNEYATKVKQQLFEAGFMCDVDTDDSDTMNKKIRNAQLAQYNFIMVVGEKELSGNTVNIRTRDNLVHGEFTIDAVIEKFKALAKSRIVNSEENF
ncbi:hypothetical protein FOCC_FOCC000129 [Frankliniella occidentalis]|nr:hypothetical protein FOCC_FOCC000129 [Frankliniella occidentalis]